MSLQGFVLLLFFNILSIKRPSIIKSFKRSNFFCSSRFQHYAQENVQDTQEMYRTRNVEIQPLKYLCKKK